MVDTLRAGEKLTPGQKLVSANGLYELVYQTDGNLVLYGPGGRKVWASRTQGNSASAACMQADGHFCLYNHAHAYYWGSGAHGFADGRIVVQDDRNVVVYRGDGSPAWSTKTARGDTLDVGEKLTPGQKLVSKNGLYELVYQGDGNLVLYEAGGRALWASNTAGVPAGEARMQADGHFCLYKPGSVFYWGTGVHGFSNGRLVVQDDRDVVVFTAGTPAWSTRTNFGKPVPLAWLTGRQPKLLSMMAACEKRREGLSGDWWEGFAKDDPRTHAQAVAQYRDTMYVAFSQLSGAGQLWLYDLRSGQNVLRTDVLPDRHSHPCSMQVVDHYLIVAVESAYPPQEDPRPEFSAVVIYDLAADPMRPVEVGRIRQPDCNCGGAGLAFHPKTNRWYVLADQDRRGGGATRLYRSEGGGVASFTGPPIKVYPRRFGSGAGTNLITASDGSIWALYYEDTQEHLPKYMSWDMTADVVHLWKLVEADGTPVEDFSDRVQYTNVGTPQVGEVALLLNNRPGMRFGASLRHEDGQLELLTCQRNMKSTFNVDRVRLEDGKAAVMFVNFGLFESEVYCSSGGTTRHSGHVPLSQSWITTMDRRKIHANVNHNAGFTWVDDWEGDTSAPLTLIVTKGETQSAKVEIHSFTTDYKGKVEVNGHSPDGINKLDPRNW